MEEGLQTITITGCLDTIIDAAKVGLGFIADNAILMTCFAGGVVATLAFRFIRKAKRAAR